MNAIDRLGRLGLKPADILVPEDHVDASRWAVVACDQYTSEPEYWDNAKQFVGGSPSTLNLIIPEAFLGTPAGDAMTASVPETMDKYLSSGVFKTVPGSFVYVERTTPAGAIRRGLVAAFDLERYDFVPGNKMPIRATEGTIISRLPPRIRVRRRAALECPHVLVLLDDPLCTVIEPLEGGKAAAEKLYGADLMFGAGRVDGWRVNTEAEFSRIAEALEALSSRGGMLFAVGDGNHSLAAAKACWDEMKTGLSAVERESHPARWALAELVNVHDPALSFHPIHRVVFSADTAELLAGVLWQMNKLGWAASMGQERSGAQSVKWACKGGSGYINIQHPSELLASASLQQALDEVLDGMPDARIDYVHGDAEAARLSQEQDTMAFLLEAMDKHSLFPAVERLGILPRKAFSIGEADEKRFYFECRSIRA